MIGLHLSAKTKTITYITSVQSLGLSRRLPFFKYVIRAGLGIPYTGVQIVLQWIRCNMITCLLCRALFPWRKFPIRLHHNSKLTNITIVQFKFVI